MYGLARGVGPSRDVAGSMQNAMEEDAPPLSGINAPGNSLTMAGPASEPSGINDIQNKRLKLARAMMGRGMTGFAQGMQQHNIPNVMPQQSPFDLYGNPIGVM